jgi:UDP-N-acetylglucosamine 2-epimerase
MSDTLTAVKSFNLPTVIILPHADAGGRKMIEIINGEKKNSLIHIFSNLDYTDFLALEREAAVWVGNSSGMMIESSSFHTPVVNIGSRQFGRERGKNVIDVDYAPKGIIEAIERSLNDKTYLRKIAKFRNPLGDGRAGERITKILEDLVIDQRLLNKQITY